LRSHYIKQFYNLRKRGDPQLLRESIASDVVWSRRVRSDEDKRATVQATNNVGYLAGLNSRCEVGVNRFKSYSVALLVFYSNAHCGIASGQAVEMHSEDHKSIIHLVQNVNEESLREIRAALGEPVQIGLAVRDLADAKAQLSQLLGLANWTHSQWPPKGNHNLILFHNGKPSEDWSALLATTDLGSIELELIEHTGGESTYGDFVSRVGPGLHHLMFRVDDFPLVMATFREKGMKVSTSVSIGADDVRWAVFDTHDILGFNIEIKDRRGFE